MQNLHYLKYDASYNTAKVKRDTTLTDEQRAFMLTFLVDVVADLQSVNLEAVQEGEAFWRGQDYFEVLDNYTTLVNNYVLIMHDDTDVYDAANAFNFSLDAATDAIRSYDTEYRDCIVEQFLDATRNVQEELAIKIVGEYATNYWSKVAA